MANPSAPDIAYIGVRDWARWLYSRSCTQQVRGSNTDFYCIYEGLLILVDVESAKLNREITLGVSRRYMGLPCCSRIPFESSDYVSYHVIPCTYSQQAYIPSGHTFGQYYEPRLAAFVGWRNNNFGSLTMSGQFVSKIELAGQLLARLVRLKSCVCHKHQTNALVYFWSRQGSWLE